MAPALARAARHPHVAAPAQAFPDELPQRQAVPLAEGGAGALAMVGEHDEAIGARRGLRGARERRDLAVEAAEAPARPGLGPAWWATSS